MPVKDPERRRELAKAWNRTYYEKNKKKRQQYNNDTRKRNREFILEDKRVNGCCSRCGWNEDYRILEYHHTNPSNKDKAISRMLDSSIKTIQEEMSKCVLICPNCHRMEHYDDNKQEGP